MTFQKSASSLRLLFCCTVPPAGTVQVLRLFKFYQNFVYSIVSVAARSKTQSQSQS